MTQLPEGFEKVEKNPQTEPTTSFKELPEGFEKVGKITELPEGFVNEDDLSIDDIKSMQSEGVPLSEKLQRKLWDEEDKKSIAQTVGEFADKAASNFLPLVGKIASGSAEIIEKGVINPLGDQVTFGVMNSPEVREKIWKDNDKVWRAVGAGAFGGFEELVEGVTLLATESNVLTDKFQGLSDDEKFRRYMFREATRKNLAERKSLTPDAAARMLSENPILKGITHTAARIEGATPEQAKLIVEEQMNQLRESGLTAEELKEYENAVLVGDIASPFNVPGLGTAGRFTGKLVSKATKPIVQKSAALGFKGLEKLAAGTEFAANKVIQGAELTQTAAKKIGEYTVNDPDTWIKGTVNTANLTYVPPAKLIRGTARVVKDIARQADVGGTAGRRGMVERAGKDILSSDVTKGLFGPQGKSGVARAKIADWMVRQSNAIIQPGVEAGALNVLLGLPFIETAEQAGESFSTGLAIGAIGGSRAVERVGGLVDPRTTMAQKITNLVTPDPTAYRRDEDADIKRFLAQATPELQQQMTDLADLDKRKAAVDAKIANLIQERDSQINPEDTAFKQKQIDGFIKQKEALAKSTPQTQAEALRQIQLAFADSMDLAQATGATAGLRGVNVVVLDSNNAEQFFRNLYGDSLKQAENTISLLTGNPRLTETDSQKLTEARQLLQKFQNDVAGAQSTRGFAIQEDNTDPNSENFVPPHLRRINQQGATAVINADLVKQLTSQGFNIRHTLQHEVQHAVQQFKEVQDMLRPIRADLFDQKIKNDDGTTEVYQQGIFSDEDLDRHAAQYAKMMSPSDNGASFIEQFGGNVEKMRAYVKDEILAEIAANTGEYAGGTRASLDDVGRSVIDWLEVKTKSGRLKQLKETLRKGGIIFDNAGGYSAVLGAQFTPETLAMVRQYQKGLKDFDGTMTVQQSRESDEPDIPLTKVLGSIALQNKYRNADFFEKEQIIRAKAPDGSVSEIIIPVGAKIDPFIDVYRTQGGQLVDADGNVVTLGPEITFGSMPDGTTFETDTRIARKSDGSPIILTNREMKSRALERTTMIKNAIDSAKDDKSGIRLSDTGNGNYRGIMSPSQIETFMALPNSVVSPNLKRMTKFFNNLMARGDGTRVVMEYQAALLNGKYKALSPKIRDEVPIGFQFTKDGNFLLTTISVSRLHDKMMAWADTKPFNLTLWNGDTGAFWDSVMKYLNNHANGEKGETGLHPDTYIAGRMKNRINDLFNAYNAETKDSNPERSKLPRSRGKDNLDTVIRGRRLDRINNFEESPSTKLPINYGNLTTNYMPEENPMAAPLTAEEFQNRFDGSVTATRVRQAMETGEINQLESELRQMDDILPTESLQLVQAEGEMPKIQIVSMFDPNNTPSLESEEIVSDIDAETEAELAILDAQDGTVPPQDIAKVLSAKLDQLYADGGRSPIIPALETELEKIYQQLESQAQEQEAATEEIVEAPETTEVDMMNSPQDLILTAEFVDLGKQADQLNADIRDGKTGEQYTSGHFQDIPNYVAHMRLNERTDAEGNDGLFVEEFQSDRHQAGREKGYASDRPSPEEILRKREEIFKLADAGEITREERNNRLDAIGSAGGIPDAPFRKDWSLQLFKRALRDAVESGKQWIGWTTGDTQAERYDLSKQIDRIDYSVDEDGLFSASAIKGKSEVFSKEGMEIPEVEAKFGKEIAEKMQSNKGKKQENDDGIEFRSLSGLDLKVGGEGMKGFYDTILPKEIGRYVDKMGGKVEKSNLNPENVQAAWAFKDDDGVFRVKNKKDGADPNAQVLGEFNTPEEAIEFAGNYKPQGTPIWRVNITPQMENVVRAGQLQFMPAEQTINKVPTQEELDAMKALLPKYTSKLRNINKNEKYITVYDENGKHAGSAEIYVNKPDNFISIEWIDTTIQKNKGFGQALYREIAKYAQQQNIDTIEGEIINKKAVKRREELFETISKSEGTLEGDYDEDPNKGYYADLTSKVPSDIRFLPAEQGAEPEGLQGIELPQTYRRISDMIPPLRDIEPPVRAKAMLPDMELEPTIGEKLQSSPMIGATTSEKPIQSSDIITSAKPAPDAVIKPFSNALVSSVGLINFLPAYHGTPFDVDKFKLANIGTGEGAQAYGWGLYFAQARKVGEEYSRVVGKKGGWTGTLNAEQGKIPDELWSRLEAAYLNRGKDAVKYLAEKERDKNSLSDYYDDLTRIAFDEPLEPTGNLYKVDIDVKDEDLLDWDKPLSEQSKKVQKALAEMNADYRSDSDEYDSNEQGQITYSRLGNPQEASKALLTAGIPGIRYFDGTSRKQGQGTYNYVVFDENLITILDKNDKPVQDELPRSTGLQFLPARPIGKNEPLPDFETTIIKGITPAKGFKWDKATNVEIDIGGGRKMSFSYDPEYLEVPKFKDLIKELKGQPVILLEADRQRATGGDMGGPLHPFLKSNQVTITGPDGKKYKAVWANMTSTFVSGAKNRLASHGAKYALVHLMDPIAHKSNKRTARTLDKMMRKSKLSQREKEIISLSMQAGIIAGEKSAMSSAITALKLQMSSAKKDPEKIRIINEKINKITKEREDITPKGLYGEIFKAVSSIKTAISNVKTGNWAENSIEKANKKLEKYVNIKEYNELLKNNKSLYISDNIGNTFSDRGSAIGRILSFKFGKFDPSLVMRESSDFREGENLDIVTAVELSQNPDIFALYFGKDSKEEAAMSPAERKARDEMRANPDFVEHEAYDWVMLGPEKGNNFLVKNPVKPEQIFKKYRETHAGETVVDGSAETVAGAMRKNAGFILRVDEDTQKVLASKKKNK